MQGLFILGLWFLVSGCQVLSLPNSKQPLLKKGHLDLQTWDFQKQGNISLQGEWLFQANEFLDPMQARFKSDTLQLSNIPGSPNNNVLYVKDQSIGYGTYLLHMTLPETQETLQLRLWMIQSAYVLTLRDNSNGAVQELARAGRIARNRSEALGELTERLITLPVALTRNRDITLILHVSAFYNSLGIMGVPRLGVAEQIYQEEIFKQMERALLMGGFCLVALYSFALYLGRRRGVLDLLSIAFAGILLLRYMATDWFIYWFLRGHSWIEPLSVTLIYWSTQFTVVVLSVIFAALHPLPIMVRVRNASILFNALVLVLIVFFGFDWIVTYAINILMGLLFFNMLALSGSMVYLSWIKAKDMDLMILGFSALTIAGINDYLVFFQGMSNIFLVPYAFLFFAFIQSLITGRKFARTYQRNEELLVEVSEKERARTLFFHNTSHELRTPLNGIIGFLQLLSNNRYGPQSPQSREQLMKCIRLAESLKNQVNTILDLAKSKKGNLSLENSLISLDEIFADACNLAEGLLLKRQDSRFDREKSWTPESAHFIGDREKVATILRNLLGNAFKFADPQRSNHVKMLIKRDRGQLVISISDTGIGIPQGQREVIFEEFRQVADDARRNYEGTGLGLSMVRDLIDLMKGRIEVQSEPGRGSTFTVFIPEQTEIHVQQSLIVQAPTASYVLAESAQAAAPMRSLTVKRENSQQQRLLVVDDNEINCEVIQHMLEEQGYEVLVAYGGQEALTKMRTEIPDMILLDMMMPQVSGEDVLRAMKADPLLLDIPVILITARASEDDRIFGLSLGADDYLAKPIHQAELNMRVRNLLSRLDLNRRMVQMEERDRLAQLGELLSELSHELKNIFQFSDLNQRIDRPMLSSLIQRLPITETSWIKAAEILADGEMGDASEGGAEGLSFISLQQSEDPVLRSLRTRLAHLPLQKEDKLAIWQKIQELPEKDRNFCDHQLILVRSFVLLRDQSRYARELIMDILEFNRTQDESSGCELIKTVETVLKLCRPRLARQRIRVELSLVKVPVRISAGALMQVLLNLLSNAADAMQTLPSGERWLKISADIRKERLVLRISNSGQPIPESIARRIFERGYSTKGSQGSGLGLSIVWRLLQRAHGTIELDQSAGSPSFKISLIPAKRSEGGPDELP